MDNKITIPAELEPKAVEDLKNYLQKKSKRKTPLLLAHPTLSHFPFSEKG